METGEISVALSWLEAVAQEGGRGARLKLVGGVDDAAAKRLADDPRLGRLEELRLGLNRLGSRGLAALAESPQLERLKVLELRENRIDDEGLRAVARSTRRGALEELRLGENLLSDAGLEALARAEHLGSLRMLDVSRQPQVTARGVEALRRSPFLGRLTEVTGG